MTLQPPTQSYPWTFQRVVEATLILVFVVLCFGLLYRFNQVVFIFFIAIVLGTVIRPAVNWLYQRGLPRIAGVLVVYLLLFALFISFAFLLVPLIVEQGATIALAVPGYYQSLQEWTVNHPNPFIMQLSGFLPTVLPGFTPAQQTGEEVMASAEQALGYIASAGQAIFIVIVIPILSFYWTLDGPRTIHSLLLLVPTEHRETIRELVAAMETKVGFFLAGQGVLCIVIGLLALVAYLLIGLPNALVLALVAGLLEAVPLIGPLLGAIPAAVIALSIAPSKVAWVIAATLVIQQVENSVLVPRVMRHAVGVNPFVSLLAIFAFSTLFGIAGALMAIPITAMIQLLLERFVFRPGTMELDAPAGRDFASRLRYEAQDLAQDLRKQARLKKGGTDLRVKQIDQVMDEIEALTTDLDSLLAQVNSSGVP